MLEQIRQIQRDYLAKIHARDSLEALDILFLELFGKSGVITVLPKDFPKSDPEQLRQIGPAFNQAKQTLEIAIEEQRNKVKETSYAKLVDEDFDITKRQPLPEKQGQMHIGSEFEADIINLFKQLKFEQYAAPHIDSDLLNFEMLNIPPEHPARDLWDTFYIAKDNLPAETGTLLLRTHTSNSQIRIMKDYQAPFRAMDFGRCFRYENLDARHEHTFDQFELIYVDKDLSMANLQYLSEYFLKHAFGVDTKVRLRPKYYPFVEPGAGVDALCPFCKGDGCKVCGGVGWLEIAGAGMMHPTVLKNGGVDPEVYSGIAWGTGLGRMLMIKNGLTDLRILNSGDLKLLSEFQEGKDAGTV